MSTPQEEIDAVTWYHEFDLGNGLTARANVPDAEYHRRSWRFTEHELSRIDFQDKSVLEVGCWDGYWSFYAERQGTASVLASDDLTQNWANGEGIRLAKRLLNSQIDIKQDQSVYDLARLGRTFDIILWLGVYLPTMFTQREHIEAGGMLSCGPSLSAQYHRAATSARPGTPIRMKAGLVVFMVMIAIGSLVAPLASEAQPVLEEFRLNPDRLCFRDTFRWGFSYRGLPGGLAAAKDVEIQALWDGPGEQSIRSLLTPARDELQGYAADQGRFESRTLHFGAPRKAPGEIRYTLRVVLADGREVTSSTSARYVDACPPPAVHTTLATGPTGRIGFQTTTPSASEFLQAIRPAGTSLIWGDLELPPGPAGRSPAVLVMHGSGGVSVREDRWADELRRAGAATFVLDSFTGRGITFTAEDQSQLSSLAMLGDTYRALELLATHPRIDPARIAVMGFSKGAIAALYSAVTRFQRLHGPAGVRFAQHIAFYPPCLITYIGDGAVTDRPIRVFQGTADDLAPIEPCRAYVERLQRAGADAQLTAYAGAHHQFDRPGDRVRHNPREQNVSRCLWEERPEGQLVSRATGQPFSLDDPCVSRGGSFGPDPVAYRAALEAVKALVGMNQR